jgi:hypothetical protein
MSGGWFVHVQGPDDMVPMPSREAAEAEALALNAHFERTYGPDPDPLLPPMRAVVVQIEGPS